MLMMQETNTETGIAIVVTETGKEIGIAGETEEIEKGTEAEIKKESVIREAAIGRRMQTGTSVAVTGVTETEKGSEKETKKRLGAQQREQRQRTSLIGDWKTQQHYLADWHIYIYLSTLL
jgi:hypothetical protein